MKQKDVQANLLGNQPQYLYNRYSDFLKLKYGCKVYKLPVNIPSSCPNRCSNNENGGCIFCGEEGAGFELLPSNLSVLEQLRQNMGYINKKYKAQKFIAYFQNYTNTYLLFDYFCTCINEACIEDIVALYISTRPDCVNERYLDFLNKIKNEKNIDIVIELGLQTVNYHTLERLNRGHGLAEFIDAVLRIKKFSLDCCAHVIVDLPWDTMLDVCETSRVISALGVDQVKCHSLYILENTRLGDMYNKKEFKPLQFEEYVERIILFLEHLSPDIVIQRLIGRAPEERTLFCNWGKSWWKIQDIIEEKMRERRTFQGRLFNYLNGTKFPLFSFR